MTMLKLVASETIFPKDFQDFWRLYPRKVAKQDAIRAWQKLSYEDRSAAIRAINDHRSWWAGFADKQFIPHASTWLNGRRFEDELEVDLHVTPCHWKGCDKAGTKQSGNGVYCEKHYMAIARGETP